MARAVVGPRLPGPVGRRQVERLRGRVEQDGADVDRGDAVDQRVVHLGQQRDALAAGDALDDRELPQRPRAVQAPRQLLADELGQLVRAAGRRQGGAADVPAEVELRRRRPRPGSSPRARATAGAGGSAGSGAGAGRRARAPRACSRPGPASNTSTPPTPIVTGPCSAASEERSAAESASAIREGSRPTQRLHSHEGAPVPARAGRRPGAGRARPLRPTSRSRSRTTRTARRPRRSRSATPRRSAATSAATRWCGTTAIATTNMGPSKTFTFPQPGNLRATTARSTSDSHEHASARSPGRRPAPGERLLRRQPVPEAPASP